MLLIIIIYGEGDKRSFKFFTSHRIIVHKFVTIAVDCRCPVVVCRVVPGDGFALVS